MDDPSDLRSKLKATLVGMGAWGGTAAVAALVPADYSTAERIIAAAGLGTLAAALSDLPKLLQAFSVRNWFRVLFGFTKEHESEDDASRLLNAAMLDATGQAVLFEVLRKMNDATDPAVLPSIGKLMREYLEQTQPIDSFFRGVVRTLLDVTAAELASLKIMLRAIRDSKNQGPFVDIMVHPPEGQYFDFSDTTRDRLRIALRPQTRSEGYEFEEVENPRGGARRLFHLLITYGVAIDPGLTGGAPAIAMDKPTAARFLALIEEA